MPFGHRSLLPDRLPKGLGVVCSRDGWRSGYGWGIMLPCLAKWAAWSDMILSPMKAPILTFLSASTASDCAEHSPEVIENLFLQQSAKLSPCLACWTRQCSLIECPHSASCCNSSWRSMCAKFGHHGMPATMHLISLSSLCPRC